MQRAIPQKVRRHYDSLAGDYDARWEDYLRNTHEQALRHVTLKPGDRILDAGGGTGLFAEQLLNQCDCHLTLIDISDEMLRRARQRLGRSGKVDLESMDVHKLHFADNSFDYVFSLSNAHYYRDVPVVLSEVRRVLRRQGRLILIDWCADPLYFKLFDKGMRLLRRPYVRSYTTSEIARMAGSAGFSVDSVERWNHRWWPLMTVVAHRK